MPSSTLTLPTPRVFRPLLDPARYKGAWGGRGSGKSHFFADLLIEQCVRHKTSAVCIREVQKSLKQSVKLLVENKIQQHGLGRFFNVLVDRIEAPHGGQIIFQGMQDHTAESIKSLEGFDVAWVEEAQSLSYRSLQLLRPTIRAERSELWFTWNPSEPTDAVDDLLRGPEAIRSAGGVCVVEANWRDNPWFPPELEDERRTDLERSPETYDHVWEGGYRHLSDAAIFGNRVKVQEFETPGHVRQFYYGADWGFSQDPTVLVRCYISDDILYVDHEAFGWHVELDDIGPKVFDEVPESRRWPIRADSANPAQISYMRRQGYNVSPAEKWPGSIEDGIRLLKAFKQIVVHPRCANIAQEFRLYSYKTDPKQIDPATRKPMVLPIIVDKHNHGIDALRYALAHFIQRGQGMMVTPEALAWSAGSDVGMARPMMGPVPTSTGNAPIDWSSALQWSSGRS